MSKSINDDKPAHDCLQDHDDPNMPIHDCPHHRNMIIEKINLPGGNLIQEDTHDCDNSARKFEDTENPELNEKNSPEIHNPDNAAIDDSELTSTQIFEIPHPASITDYITKKAAKD